MNSFNDQGYLMDPDWEYEEAAVPYVPIEPAGAYGYTASVDGFPAHDAISEQALLYLPPDYAQPGTASVSFQIPTAPASASRRENRLQQHQRPMLDSELDAHAKRIKRTRTACEECRKRKQKCDGAERCQPCTEQGTDCKYRDVPPTKKDDTMEKMLQAAKDYNRALTTLNSDVMNMATRLRSIEARLNRSLPADINAVGIQSVRPQNGASAHCSDSGQQNARVGSSSSSEGSS